MRGSASNVSPGIPSTRLVAWLALACTLLLAPLAGWAATERIPPAPKRHFTDETRTVSPTTAQRLNAQLEQYERESSNQILVAMYPRMQSNSSAADYTVRVAQAWQVGQKGRSNGAVLFVFKDDRQVYLQVGYGLEAVLPDATAHDIVENIVKPRFRAGQFDQGLIEAVGAIIAATRGEFKGTGRLRAEAAGSAPAPVGIVALFFVIFMFSLFFRHGRRRTVLLGGPHIRRGRGPSVWMGGGGFGGGGGGFGGGGFSGGGGGFGGGGAGGRW